LKSKGNEKPVFSQGKLEPKPRGRSITLRENKKRGGEKKGKIGADLSTKEGKRGRTRGFFFSGTAAFKLRIGACGGKKNEKKKKRKEEEKRKKRKKKNGPFLRLKSRHEQRNPSRLKKRKERGGKNGTRTDPAKER